MAKAKTKEVGFGGKATEVRQGVWEFKIGARMYQWRDQMGINLFLVNEMDNSLSPMIYAKTLKEAALFCEGFEAGRAYAAKVQAEALPLQKT